MRSSWGFVLTRGQGRYQLELVRDPVLQEKGLNPWRIRKHVAMRAW